VSTMTSLTRDVTPDGRDAWFARSHAHVTELMLDKRLNMRPPSTEVASWFDDKPMHRALVRLANQAIPDGWSDQEDRARRRDTLNKTFRGIHRALPDVRAYADALLDGMIADGAPADLSDRFSQPLCAKVICNLVDMPDSDVVRLRRWADDKEARDYSKVAPALRQLNAYVKDLIARRVAEPGDDVVSVLLAAEPPDSSHMGRSGNVIAWILGLGWQVPAGAIDFGMLMLMTHPEQMRLLQENPSLMKGAVEEVLRHYDPTPPQMGGTDRFADVDFEYAGAQIRKGDLVVLDVVAANHDPEVFTDPDVFDIRREKSPHVTFGLGYYFCNFHQVARQEMAVGLEAIMRRLPHIHLAQPPETVQYLRFPSNAPSALSVAW
jgi:cytochrome P450